MRTTLIVAAMCALGATAAALTTASSQAQVAGNKAVTRPLQHVEDVPVVMPRSSGTRMQAKKAGAPARYDLPLMGNDLDSGERYYVGKKIQSHLAEQMQVAAADRQHILAAAEMDVGSFVLATRHMADGPQVDHDGAVDLREMDRIQLRD